MSNNQAFSTNLLTENAYAPGNPNEATFARSTWYTTPMGQRFRQILDGADCTDEEWRKLSDTHMFEIRKWKKSVMRTHAGHALGAREFTLTYSPNWMNDDEARMKMRIAISKLCKYYKDEIVELRAVGEVGQNGLSHVHCFYKLLGGLKMTDKNFKRAWSYWDPKKKLQRGFQGGHHAEVKNEADFKGYIDKDADTAWMDVSKPDASDPV